MAGVRHKCHTREVKRCIYYCYVLQEGVGECLWPKTAAYHYHALLGLTSKVYVIKGLVVSFVSVFDNKIGNAFAHNQA